MQELRPGDPRRIGPYEVLGRLGGGGMGQVYLASAGRMVVAAKVVHPALAQDPRFRARFQQEVENGRRIGPPWAAAVLAADPTATTPWLATSYIPGPSLEQAVRACGALPTDTVHRLARMLAEALAHVHAAGLVHRDVKPSNVLLGPDRPHLIDLGIARSMDGTRVTATGVAVGTPGFMSPEQAEGGEIGPPSDVFAFGAVVAFAVRGEGPFGSGNAYAVLMRVTDEEPDLAGVPEPLRGVVAACLAKDPAARPTAARVVEMLTPSPPGPAAGWLPPAVAALDPTPRWLDRAMVETMIDVSGAGPGPAPSGPGTTPPRVRRRGVLVLAGVLGVAALGGAGAAGALLLGGPEQPGLPAPPVPPPVPATTTGARQPAQRWAVDAIGFVPDTILVTPDTLYPGAEGTLAALDIGTGAERWRFAAQPAGEGFSRASVVASADASTGTVYMATYAALYALEATTGGVRWRTPLPTEPVAGLLEVSAAGGRVYATAGNALLGVDPASGRVLWTHQVPDRYAASPVALGDRCLVAGGATVDAVADGRLLWRHTDDRVNATRITVADGTAYLVVNDEGGTVKALDTATGAARWISGMGTRRDRSAPPVVAGGVVAVHGDEQVIAFDIATGARRWSAPDRVTGGGTVDTPPVALGSTVYATNSRNGRLYAFDAATGVQLWVVSTDVGSPWLLAAGPAVADTLFVASIGGDVQAWGNG